MIASAAVSPPIEIRAAWPEDQAFVAATFAEQLERGHHDKPHAIVDRVLDSSSTRVLIATRHGRIVGWLAYVSVPRVRAVLFVYVRRQERAVGVARQLVDAAFPRAGQWVHGGLRGGSTKSLLQRFSAIEMPLEDLI